MAEELEEKPEAAPSGADEGEYYMERRPELEPTEFREGFTMKTFLGALFIGVIMMPGAIYLALMMGQSMGSAGQWTTIILITEVARRSFTKVSRQELYMIYYMAGSLLSAGGTLAGGAFAYFVWNAYLINSTAAQNFGIAKLIPRWVAPPLGSSAYIQRTFLHHDWTIPIVLTVLGSIFGRAQWIGMGYFLFRTTSDVERLPFPMAPIAAQGATALAEVSEEKESWRWPVFSVATMIGLVYGFFYVAIPVITGGFLADPLKLIPIPFIDFVQNAEDALPTNRIAIATDLGPIFWGFVLPFPIVVGGFITSMFTNFLFSPLLYHFTYSPVLGKSTLFPQWSKGMNLIQSQMILGFDFYMSFGIGISLAIAAIGLYSVLSTLLKARVARAQGVATRGYRDVPAGRGDFPIWLALVAWALPAVYYVILGHYLVPRFPVYWLIFFAFVWTPVISYVSARMNGLRGWGIDIPYVRPAVFILSGYKGVDIWFAPINQDDHGWAASQFREVELTGTRMVSVVKAEAFLLVLMLFCSFVYWSFFWKTSQIPSSQYPYAQMFWPLNAFWQCLWATATMPHKAGEATFLLKAVKPSIIGYTGGGAMALYWIMSAFRVPTLWYYGLIGGFADTTWAIPSFIGAMLGRYYFARRFGKNRWRQYTPVLAAGYACGVGLIGMVSIGLTIIFKAVRSLPF